MCVCSRGLQTEMEAVPVGDTFHCELGADPAIQVQYKPLTRHREGIAKASTVTHKQLIALHNTYARPIKLSVYEPLPVTTEEKIKVPPLPLP